MIHYSCIGATGYVCGEVLRMMVNHHEGELVNVLDTYGVGDAISTHHPALRGFYDQVIMDLTEENVRETAKKSDVIMIQVPSGDVAKWAEIVLAEDCAIIDIGADIRFRDVDVWEKWYGQKHPDAKMTHDAVYCIPEVMRDLAKGKKLIANPGCYPTASSPCSRPVTSLTTPSSSTPRAATPAQAAVPPSTSSSLRRRTTSALTPSAAATATRPRSSRTLPTSLARI